MMIKTKESCRLFILAFRDKNFLVYLPVASYNALCFLFLSKNAYNDTPTPAVIGMLSIIHCNKSLCIYSILSLKSIPVINPLFRKQKYLSQNFYYDIFVSEHWKIELIKHPYCQEKALHQGIEQLIHFMFSPKNLSKSIIGNRMKCLKAGKKSLMWHIIIGDLKIYEK